MGKVECKACGVEYKKKECTKIRGDFFCIGCRQEIADSNYYKYLVENGHHNITKSEEEINNVNNQRYSTNL